MRTAVPADAHVDKLECLPKKIADAISTVDSIIDAGDFTDIQLLKELQRPKETRAVHGNMDSSQLKSVLPMEKIVETNDKRIGITHGSGAP
jgi:putative phosphoesterase